jgi:hypothetical protein
MGLDWVRSDQSAPKAANPASIGTGGDDTTTSGEAASVYEADALLSAPAETDVSSVSVPAPDPAQLARRNDEGPVTGDSAPVRASVAPVTAPATASNSTLASASNSTPAPIFTPLRRNTNGEAPAAPAATTANRAASAPITTAPPVSGEIPDNYVAPRRPSSETRDDAASVTAANRGTPTAIANVVRQPVPFVESLGSTPSVIPSTPVPTPTVSSPPVVPAAAAGAAAIVTADSEKPRVRSVLDQYARAYGRLDASAVRSVWPTVDEGALAKAFSTLSSQTVSFDNCDIDFEGTSTARALCRGRASYVGKVGSQEPRSESRTVRFELKRDGDAWKIQKAQTGR